MIACEPLASVDVVHVAAPEARTTEAQIVAVPSRNVTVPVAPPSDPETVALNVTACPDVLGFADEASPTVGTALTDCASALEVAEA